MKPEEMYEEFLNMDVLDQKSFFAFLNGYFGESFHTAFSKYLELGKTDENK